MPEYMENLLPPTLSLLVTALVSVIIGIYLEKFKSRLTLLKYRLFFHPIATSTQNDYWGNIAVFYNGRQTNHLTFATIEVINDSNIGLQDVNVDIWVDTNSQILGNTGFYKELGNIILLEQRYYDYFMQVLERNNEDLQFKEQDPDHITPTHLLNEIKWVLANKKFHLPIFNRHSSITLNLLIENFQGSKPETRISVLHKSVKLIEQEEKAAEDKKLGINMVIWGLIVFVISVWLVQRKYSDSTTPLVIVGIIGVLYLFIGFLIYRLIKFIKYLLA